MASTETLNRVMHAPDMPVPTFAEKRWLNDSFREFVTPDYLGQIGFQESDGSRWEALSLNEGDWKPA